MFGFKWIIGDRNLGGGAPRVQSVSNDVIDGLDGHCHIILPNQGIRFTLFSVTSGLCRRTHDMLIIDPFFSVPGPAYCFKWQSVRQRTEAERCYRMEIEPETERQAVVLLISGQDIQQ